MIRIGCVQYLNALPLLHGWQGDVEFDHPSALCRRLAAGELDVALVSSFEYLRAPQYSIVDGVGIGADGPVYSVFVAHRAPIEKVRAITIDPASATSVNLLRVMLAERNLPARLVDADGDAQLLIGDQAIAFRMQHGDAISYWDLAEQWKLLTGLPFVFALWLIRPEVPAAEAAAIADALRNRRTSNLSRIPELSELISKRESRMATQKPEFLSFYFEKCLRFQFAAREKEGLIMFRALCEKHGILSRNVSPGLRLI